MDGFTVGNSKRFLESGFSNDLQSMKVERSPKETLSPGGPSASGETSFADTLQQAISNVNKLQVDADKASQNLATGKTDNIADVMIAAEKADVALKVMVQVRNKIIDAYQEIMRMQV